MSPQKKDPSFPTKITPIPDRELAQIIATLLRRDFGKYNSAVKQIGLLTHANLKAIKNWYAGRNAPSAAHLLLLARLSPGILQFVLEQVGGEDLWAGFTLTSIPQNTKSREIKIPRKSAESAASNVPRNVPIKTLNERQRWFLDELTKNKNVTSNHIAEQFQVAKKTAKRDIANLKETGVIEFIGARKQGRYRIT